MKYCPRTPWHLRGPMISSSRPGLGEWVLMWVGPGSAPLRVDAFTPAWLASRRPRKREKVYHLNAPSQDKPCSNPRECCRPTAPTPAYSREFQLPNQDLVPPRQENHPRPAQLQADQRHSAPDTAGLSPHERDAQGEPSGAAHFRPSLNHTTPHLDPIFQGPPAMTTMVMVALADAGCSLPAVCWWFNCDPGMVEVVHQGTSREATCDRLDLKWPPKAHVLKVWSPEKHCSEVGPLGGD